MNYEDYIEQGLNGEAPLKLILRGSIQNSGNEKVGVVSVDFPGLDNAEAAFQLERDYGVLTRCGLHCAPLAHRTLGTFPAGTVRFSVGPFTRFEDVDYLQAAVCGVMGV